MFGSALMRGESLGKPVTSRKFEPRYPKAVRVDFRRLEDQTLRRYLQANQIDFLASTPSSELACLVAKHFELETLALQPAEEDVILRGFSEYVMNFCGGNTLEDLKSRPANNKRLRKKTRRNNSVNSDGSDDESHSADEVVPPPREVTGRAAAAAAAAAAQAAAQADAQDSQNEEDEVFCVCHGASYGEMVACDNQACQGGEWFHVGCVGLKSGETDQQRWFCPTCRE